MKKVNEEFVTIPVSKINDSPYQGRMMSTETDGTTNKDKNMEELVRSIQASGLVTPVIVRPLGNGYELIDGHRRVFAFRQLGISDIKAIVYNSTDKEAQIMSITGNLLRKNLATIELALAYKKILDEGLYKDRKAFSLALGKDESHVSDLLNTLKMDSRVIDDLASSDSIKDLRLLRLIRNAGPADKDQISDIQWQLYRRAVDEKLSRSQLSEIIKGDKKPQRRSWKMGETKHKLSIKLSITHFTPEQKEKLKIMIEQKMNEIYGVI